METKPYEFKASDYATYRFRVTHDDGKIIMSVLARDEAHGKQRIMDNEGCPDRSIETLLFSPIKKITL